MTTFAVGNEVQVPSKTVKLYVPVASPEIVVLVPVPVVVALEVPVRVKVQVTDAGKPLNSTLPVATVQEGWVIVATGAVTSGRNVMLRDREELFTLQSAPEALNVIYTR